MTSLEKANSNELSSLDSTSLDDSEDYRNEEDEYSILCEIVGARHLTIHDDQEAGNIDIKSLLPFCVVKCGDRVIHKTKHADEKGCNPIWTVATKCLFLIKAKPKDFSQAILNITVFSKRESSLPVSLVRNRNIFLGQVNLNANDILSRCDEQRFEVNIEDEFGEASSFLGHLALRFRIASSSDVETVRNFNAQSVLLRHPSTVVDTQESNPCLKKEPRPIANIVTETDESKIVRSSLMNALSSVFSASTIRDQDTGEKRRRIKPGPDPDRLEATEFMTAQEIRVETRSPSKNWIEAGSGSLGKLYVEVLACHDLPNVDVGEAVGNVTDSFVCLVYEDCCAMTDVIDDELSPHWLPWTQRAFCFKMMHPASLLYLGVFDYDLGIGDHEAIGRVAINVSNLQRNTIYTLKYNLYTSSNVTDRSANGSVTIRLRVECEDEKKALLAALKPRPKIHINVRKEKSFKVMRYTCFGLYDGEEKFDLTVTRSYVNEILGYKRFLSYLIGDTVRSLVFWRGQVKIFEILVPLHSLLFFMMSAVLVERPSTIIPFSLLSVPWAMLATLNVRQQHPSPWNRCPPFWHYIHLLRTGKSTTFVSQIKEYEGHEEANAYERAWQKRLDDDNELAEKQWELQQEIDAIGGDIISTQLAQSAIPLDLLERLARWQGIVGRICGKCRQVKIIASWEESIVSFWFTAVFLAAGLVSLLLPWGFILKWTGRLVVWGALGPHMKLVDLVLVSSRKKDSTLKNVMENFDIQSKSARLRREEALKQKVIKELTFGKFSIRVPSFNLARHYDRPLPESSARLCRAAPKRPGQSRRVSVANLMERTPWIPGQQLYGVMIPRPEHEANTQQLEVYRHQKRLEELKVVVRQVLESQGGNLRERLKLTRMGFESDIPVSFGYEVVRQETEEVQPTATRWDVACKNMSVKRVSVAFTDVDEADDDDDDSALNDRYPCNEIVLEDNGEAVYEVTDGREVEEEGIEIVGLGRYSTTQDGDLSEDELLMSSSDELAPETEDSRVSSLHKTSETVYVAFYRPLNREPKKHSQNINDID